MGDLERLQASSPWVLHDRMTSTPTPADTGRLAGDDTELRRQLPQFARLMRLGRWSTFEADGKAYRLVAWPASPRHDGFLGWLCLAPPDMPPPGIHPLHALVLRHIGGIVEVADTPSRLLLNHNDALLPPGTYWPELVGIIHERYADESNAGTPPANLDEYLPIAYEANGNVTVCHPADGDVLLFARDHAFDDVVPLWGAPPDSLYRIRGCTTLRDWIERVATDHLAVIELPN